MIRSSFIFLERIGQQLEEDLWRQGIRDWDSFLSAKSIKGLSGIRKAYYDRKVREARSALYNFNSTYFKSLLPQSEYWRLYDFFKEDAVFLDIETTGLGWHDDITMIGLYNGIDTKIMIKSINLDYKAIKQELEKYKLIVTFNGASFDLPFISKRYPNILPNVPNFDVRVAARKLGLVGGLKRIERDMGIKRQKIVEEFDGGDAVTLWRMYKATGDEYYLNLLVEYNEEDIINLKTIAEHCVSNLKKSTLPALGSPP